MFRSIVLDCVVCVFLALTISPNKTLAMLLYLVYNALCCFCAGCFLQTHKGQVQDHYGGQMFPLRFGKV